MTNHSEGYGNESDWSTEGWVTEWRRIGLEWWQYRIYDPAGRCKTAEWIDYHNPFYTNLVAKMKREVQYFASLTAQAKAEITEIVY
jgi:hypothetical protein